MVFLFSPGSTPEVIVGVVSALAILWLCAWLDYRRLCRKTLIRVKLVVDRPNQDWQFPPKWTPPTGKTKETQ